MLKNASEVLVMWIGAATLRDNSSMRMHTPLGT
jgi:hypothetical protein